MATRRGRGEGSIYQRKDGLWCATLNLGLVGGKRTRKTVYGKTKREAQVKLTEAQRDQSAGLLVAGEIPTVEKWMTVWLDSRAHELRSNTMASHRTKVTRYIVPLLGRHRLDQLAPDHIRAAYNRLREPCPAPADGQCSHNPSHGLSESTIRQTHVILHAALKTAMQDGKLTRNVSEMVTAPKTIQEKRDGLSRADTLKVLAAADNTNLASRWYVALYMGLRQGEALALRWSDVDLDNRVMHITRSVSRVKGVGLVVGTPKSRESNRTLGIPQIVASRLMVDWAKRANSPLPDALDGYVWHEPDGAGIGPKRDWEAWRDLLKAAGVAHVSLHTARHTAGQNLHRAGVPLETIREILGHASIQVTSRFYLDRDITMNKAAMVQVEDYLSEPPAITAG